MVSTPEDLMLRSFLFVPGDSERKQAKAMSSAADALIFDLEDSVAPDRLPFARQQVANVLSVKPSGAAQQFWVRTNPLSSGALLQDVTAVLGAAPAGFVLPKVSQPSEVQVVHHYLCALEVQQGLKLNSTKLIVVTTETARAVLTLGGYPVVPERLVGLTWGAEDLSAALGASSKYEVDGTLCFTCQLARSMCLLAASAAAVQPIDTLYTNFKDPAGLQADSARARRDGFTGKIAIHPDQVGVINAAFMPSVAEIERATRIVAAFADSPHAGVLSLDGEMLDRPHLLQAQSVLAIARRP
jgi:citrate lyase subunit beta/citryl-CoA lyase